MARVRKSGLDFVGDINWGTHMCQFYKTKQDLVDVLVPYFVNGLKNNEFCVWVTSEFLNKEEAIAAMQKALPGFSDYLSKGQMEILPYTEWYLKEGKFELHRVLNGWVDKHDKAIAAGYAGMRVTGNPFWIDNKKEWDDFAAYEAEINNVIDDYKLLVLCTYSLEKCNAEEIIDVVINHKFAMIKRAGKWSLIESSATKKMEETLRKAERRFADLYASMTEGVALHEMLYSSLGTPVDYKIVDVNPAFERLTGLCREDTVGKKASELYGVGDAPYINIYSQVAASGNPVSFETYFQPMDKSFSISCTSFSKGKFTTVFHDITERKKSEQALMQAKIEWERTFDSVPDLIAILDTQHQIVRVNKAMAKALGIVPEVCIGLKCYGCVHGSDSPPKACPHAKTLRDGKEHIEELHEDHLGGDFIVSTTPLFDEQGKMTGSVHVARDITTRKKLEKQLQTYTKNLERTVETRTVSLKASEDRYRLLFDSIDEGFCIVEMVFDPDGKPVDFRFLEINSTFERQTGLKDAKGKLMRSLVPNHEEHWFEIYGRIAVTGEPMRFTNEAKALNRWYDVYAFPVGEGTIRKVGILFNDITPRRNLEKQLQDQERMATIGQTAGMVGHDIRNPLQAITGDLYLLKEDLRDVPGEEIRASMQESIDAIDQNIIYIDKIVSDLQDYTRPIKPNAEAVNVRNIVNSTLSLSIVPESIETNVLVDANLTLTTDAAYLKRVLTNLVINAVQAMSKGGKLSVTAKTDGINMQIFIEDTGTGIPEEVKPHLFKPLFTTKSKGQGLGLAVVKRLVEGLNGTISFESSEGNGTKFKVELPLKPSFA